MMNQRLFAGILGGMMIFALMISCSPKQVPNEKKESEEVTNPQESVSFQVDKGISLPKETANAIGLELQPVTSNELESVIPINVQIYRTSDEKSSESGGEKSGFSYATTMIPEAQAKFLKQGRKVVFDPVAGSDQGVEGVLWKLDYTQVSIVGMVEVLVEIPDRNNRLVMGVFLKGRAHLDGKIEKVVCVPRTAVLENANGHFVYLAKEGFYLLTSVKTGKTDNKLIEITEGLRVGDTVATPVEKLWLTELRLTKGGGGD